MERKKHHRITVAYCCITASVLHTVFGLSIAGIIFFAICAVAFGMIMEHEQNKLNNKK